MKTTDNKSMKYALWLVLVLGTFQPASAGVYQHGTVVRMRMGDCLSLHHGFMVAFGPPAAQASVGELCPEYTLVSDKVVFVIVGKPSDQLVPLADVVDFRLQHNELAVRVDDAKRESKFGIKEMVLRTEWDRMQKHINDELDAVDRNAEEGIGLRARN
jgi:hypothetical protein